MNTRSLSPEDMPQKPKPRNASRKIFTLIHERNMSALRSLCSFLNSQKKIKYRRYYQIVYNLINNSLNQQYVEVKHFIELVNEASLNAGIKSSDKTLYRNISELVELKLFKVLANNDLTINSNVEELEQIAAQIQLFEENIDVGGHKSKSKSTYLGVSKRKNTITKIKDSKVITVTGKQSPSAFNTFLTLLPSEPTKELSGTINTRNGVDEYVLTGKDSIMLTEDVSVLLAVLNLHYHASVQTMDKNYGPLADSKSVYSKSMIELDDIVAYRYPNTVKIQKSHRVSVRESLERIAHTKLDIKRQEYISRSEINSQNYNQDTIDEVASLGKESKLSRLFNTLFAPFADFNSETLLVEEPNGEKRVIESASKFNISLDPTLQEYLTSEDTKYLFLIPADILTINNKYSSEIMKLYLALRNLRQPNEPNDSTIYHTVPIERLVATSVVESTDEDPTALAIEKFKLFIRKLSKLKTMQYVEVSIPQSKQRLLKLYGYNCLFDFKTGMVDVSYHPQEVLSCLNTTRKTPTMSNKLQAVNTIKSPTGLERQLLEIDRMTSVSKVNEFIYKITVQGEDLEETVYVTPICYMNVLSTFLSGFLARNSGLSVSRAMLYEYLTDYLDFENKEYAIGSNKGDLKAVHELHDVLHKLPIISTENSSYSNELPNYKTLVAFEWFCVPANAAMYEILTANHH